MKPWWWILAILVMVLLLLSVAWEQEATGAQEADWRLPPADVQVQTQIGFYSSGISPQHDYEFVMRASAPFVLLAQYPGLWDWAIVMGYYGVEFRENRACPGSMCAYYHRIGDRVYSIVGIHPDARFTAEEGLLMYVHELQHIIDMAHGEYDPRTLETRAWGAMGEAARILKEEKP